MTNRSNKSLRATLQGVRSDIAKQVAKLRELGADEAALEVELVDNQLSLALIEDDEQSANATVEREAHEIFFHATRLVAISDLFSRAAVERGLGMIWAAAMDDIADDVKDGAGNVVKRRGEDAAALMYLYRAIERRADPETYHRLVQEDLEDPELGIVVQSEEARDFLRRKGRQAGGAQ